MPNALNENASNIKHIATLIVRHIVYTRTQDSTKNLLCSENKRRLATLQLIKVSGLHFSYIREEHSVGAL